MVKEFDVFGIGNPLIDILSKVEDEFLTRFNLNKGIMHLIDEKRRTELLSAVIDPILAAGGSCANTMTTLGNFGIKSIYAGAIGSDQYGDEFEKQTLETGTYSSLRRKSYPTGSSIIFITPDAERTQNTFLGACQLFDKDDVDVDRLKQSKLLYFTGYMWDTQNQKEALEYAIQVAKENHVKIYFDVADPFAVNRSRDDFNRILAEDVDFIFANFEEAKMLSGKEELSDILKYVKKTTPKGVIKLGKLGSLVFDEEQEYRIPTYKVKAIDTTGAGDIYAAGMIYGIVQEYTLEEAGKIASFLAGKVVEQIGPRLDQSIRNSLENFNFEFD